MNRRQFVKDVAMAVAAIRVLSWPLTLFADPQPNNKHKNMKKIMIIDGGPRRNMNTAQML